jgi:hypothetical protein
MKLLASKKTANYEEDREVRNTVASVRWRFLRILCRKALLSSAHIAGIGRKTVSSARHYDSPITRRHTHTNTHTHKGCDVTLRHHDFTF